MGCANLRARAGIALREWKRILSAAGFKCRRRLDGDALADVPARTDRCEPLGETAAGGWFGPLYAGMEMDSHSGTYARAGLTVA